MTPLFILVRVDRREEASQNVIAMLPEVRLTQIGQAVRGGRPAPSTAHAALRDHALPLKLIEVPPNRRPGNAELPRQTRNTPIPVPKERQDFALGRPGWGRTVIGG